MLDYIPSTRRLLDLLMQREWGRPFDEKEAADPAPVDAALSEWENDVLCRLPAAQYRTGIWPVTPELLHALNESLVDQRGNYAGERLAFALAHCGDHRPAVIDALNPWDALVFRWREANFSAESLFSECSAAGVASCISPADMALLQGWLDNPLSSLNPNPDGYPGFLLFGSHRLVALRHSNDGGPDYCGLFSAFAKQTKPPLDISDISQDYVGIFEEISEGMRPQLTKDVAIELIWRITYSIDGASAELDVYGDCAWLNDFGLILRFNDLLKRLGRAERAFKFAKQRGGNPFVASYIVADPGSFIPLCGRLKIPLEVCDVSGYAG